MNKKHKRYGQKNKNRENKIQDRIWDNAMKYVKSVCSEYGDVRIKK